MHSILESTNHDIVEENLVLIQVSVNSREENDRALDASINKPRHYRGGSRSYASREENDRALDA